MRIMRFVNCVFPVMAVSALLAAPIARSEEIIATHYGSLLVSAPIAVALERGEFRKRGVDITDVLSSTGGGTTMRNLLAGNLPYGEIGTAAVLAAYKQGATNIRIVNASVRTLADLFWVTMPNSGIRSIKDLAGKKIGITAPKGISETASTMAFELAGMRGQVQQVAVGSIPVGLTALEKGGVDATLILEPLFSAREDRYRIAFDLSNLPPMTQTVGVTTVEYASRSPDKLRAIIAARRAAVDFIYENPTEAARMIAKRYGTSLPEDVAIKAVKHMVAIKYWSRGNFEMDGLDTALKALQLQGDWQGSLDWNQLLDRSFLPDDLRN